MFLSGRRAGTGGKQGLLTYFLRQDDHWGPWSRATSPGRHRAALRRVSASSASHSHLSRYHFLTPPSLHAILLGEVRLLCSNAVLGLAPGAVRWLLGCALVLQATPDHSSAFQPQPEVRHLAGAPVQTWTRPRRPVLSCQRASGHAEAAMPGVAGRSLAPSRSRLRLLGNNWDAAAPPR